MIRLAEMGGPMPRPFRALGWAVTDREQAMGDVTAHSRYRSTPAPGRPGREPSRR